MRSWSRLPFDPYILSDFGIVRATTTATAQGIVSAAAPATGGDCVISATASLRHGIIRTAPATDMTDRIVRAASAANMANWIIGAATSHRHTGSSQHGNS
ncbi:MULTISPECIES: hypothetical protein [unclassified Sphingobium]|uniref:hypothetical protein n=1 Tax=unclassified Sphingobium TaxID=2611147 RepID=UPI0035A61FA7